MLSLLARKFQALSFVVLLVTTFSVLAVLVLPASAQGPVPLMTRPFAPHADGPRVPGFTPTVNGSHSTPASPASWNESVLYSFDNGNDGGYPFSGLTSDAAGNLYGTTLGDTVFEVSPNGHGGWTETVLYTFCSQNNCTDGDQPYSTLILDSAGNLFGTTLAGGIPGCFGSGCGTVFELSPNGHGGWTETVLYSFCSQNGCTDGANPYAGLIFDAAGNLYGTTPFGGNNGSGCNGFGEYGCGTVFELSPAAGMGWTEAVLYAFPDYNGTDGFMPYAGLIMGGAGSLYGTTLFGGAYNEGNGGGGTAFELSPTGGGAWSETKLYSFDNGSDGSGPFAGLILDAAGNLYGTTEVGGTNGNGTAFELSSTGGGSWTETVLYNFCSENGCLDGSLPLGALLFDAAGNLYGTTEGGGTGGSGTVFELTQQQVPVNIVNFDFGAVPISCSTTDYAYQNAISSCIADFPTQNFNQSPGFGWLMGGAAARSVGGGGVVLSSAGLTGAGTILNPPPFTGFPFSQAAFLQGTPSFARQALVFPAGSYTLSFYLGSRFEDPPHDGNQTVEALIDGNVVGTWALSSFTPFTLETAAFTASFGGMHTLEFRGVAQGDHTAFLSYVTIAPTDRRRR